MSFEMLVRQLLVIGEAASSIKLPTYVEELCPLYGRYCMLEGKILYTVFNLSCSYKVCSDAPDGNNFHPLGLLKLTCTLLN